MHKWGAESSEVLRDAPAPSAHSTARYSQQAPRRSFFVPPREVRSLDRWAMMFIAVIVLSWGLGMVAGFEIALVILTAFAYLAAIVGLRKPLIGLLGIGMLCTLDAISRVLLLTGGLLRWNSLNYWLLCVIALNMTFLLKQRDIQTRFALLFVVMLAFGLLLISAQDLEMGAQSVLNVVTFFGLLIYFAFSKRNPRIWYLQGLVCGSLAALGSFVYFMQISSLPFVNPNAWAYFPLTAIFSICLGYKFAPRGWQGQVLCWSLAVANLAWVFLSGSRGSLLVGSTCIMFLLLTTRSMSQRFVYAGLAVVVAIVAIAEFTDLNADAIHRITKLLDPKESVGARTSGRSDLALGAWYIFKEHPLGIGTGGFAQAWANMGYRQSLSGYGYGKEVQAHSGWTKTLAENGFQGTLVLAGFVSSFAVVGWRRRRFGVWSLGLLTTTVFALAFLSTDFAGKGLWYLAAGSTILLNLKAIVPRNRSRLIPGRPIAEAHEFSTRTRP